jgi:tetratricopeptide (TPR) repeat protein
MANELEAFQVSYFGRKTPLGIDYREYQENLVKAQTTEITGAIRQQTEAQAVQGAVLADNINRSMQRMQTGITAVIDDQTNQLLASQNAIQQEIGHGFTRISNQLGDMRADFNMGFAHMEMAIDRLSENICNRLDSLCDIVNNPRRTAARELYRHALANYRKGYFEEALPVITEAIEKDKTDYISWFLEGEIYAYGVGEFGNVINLDKAIDAFANACKYIKHDAENFIPYDDSRKIEIIKKLRDKTGLGLKEAKDLVEQQAPSGFIRISETQGGSGAYGIQNIIGAGLNAHSTVTPIPSADAVRGLAAEINFHFGLVQLAKSTELYRVDKGESEKLLAASREAFERSYRYSERMLESLFNIARCKVLQENASIQSEMRTLIEQDWRYYLKAKADPDFAPVCQAIDDLVKTMRDEEYALCGTVLQKACIDYKQANECNIVSYMESSDTDWVLKHISQGVDKNLPYIDMRNKRKDFQEIADYINDAVNRAKQRKAEAAREEAECKAEAERKETERQNAARVAEADRQKRLEDNHIATAAASRVGKASVVLFILGSIPAVASVALALLYSDEANLIILAIIGIVVSALIIFLPPLAVIAGGLAVLLGIFMMFGNFGDRGSSSFGTGLFLTILAIYTIVISILRLMKLFK